MPAKAYCNPHSRWNGWATPSFEPKELLALLDQMIGNEDEYIKYEMKDDRFVHTHIEDEEIEEAEFYNIDYNGKTIQLVEPPSGWCWDIITPEQSVLYYAENLKETLGKEGAIKQAIVNAFDECNESNLLTKNLILELREKIHSS